MRRAAHVALAVALVAGCSPGGTVARFCQPPPPPVAHRGGTERAFENSLAAFEAAGAAGVRQWELDVRFDARGRPVVLHDPTVDRVSPRTGPVAKIDTAASPVRLDDGQPLPSLALVMAAAARWDARVFMEPKAAPSPAQWAALGAAIDAGPGRSAVTAISFDVLALAQARARLGVASALLTAGSVPAAQGRLAGGLSAHVSRVDAASMRVWAGTPVWAWTVDDEVSWARLAPLGLRGVVTNRPIAYLAWAGGRCV